MYPYSFRCNRSRKAHGFLSLAMAILFSYMIHDLCRLQVGIEWGLSGGSWFWWTLWNGLLWLAFGTCFRFGDNQLPSSCKSSMKAAAAMEGALMISSDEVFIIKWKEDLHANFFSQVSVVSLIKRKNPTSLRRVLPAESGTRGYSLSEVLWMKSLWCRVTMSLFSFPSSKSNIRVRPYMHARIHIH